MIPSINLAAIAAGTLARANKDGRRIGLFVAACQKRAAELATSEPGQLAAFLNGSAVIASEWAPEPSKLSLAWLFGDPYKPHRERVRQFAELWNLDPVFRREMG
jgi:hypothetical protein